MTFEQKPWTNPSEKCCFWHFIELQFSGLKIFLMYPKDQKMIFPYLFHPKKISGKNFDFSTKSMDYPLRKMSIFFFKFLKLWLSGLKFILFYREYQETIFSNIISSKTLMRDFLARFKTLICWSKIIDSFPEYKFFFLT